MVAARSAFEGIMGDGCKILAPSDEPNELGTVQDTYPDSSAITALPEITCLFTPLAGKERKRPDGTASIITGRLRLPLGTAIDRRCRVLITSRFGVALASPLPFAVDGTPRDTLAFISAELVEAT